MNNTDSEIVIWHNARCGKSRAALDLLEKLLVPFHVRLYLTEPFKKAELKSLLRKLKMEPSRLVRKNEPLYKDQFADHDIPEKEWLDILVKNPVLLERPIVVYGKSALVARRAERILELLPAITPEPVA